MHPARLPVAGRSPARRPPPWQPRAGRDGVADAQTLLAARRRSATMTIDMSDQDQQRSEPPIGSSDGAHVARPPRRATAERPPRRRRQTLDARQPVPAARLRIASADADLPVRARRSSRCSPRPSTACRPTTAGCSSRSGTASARSCSATATRSTPSPATSSRSTATSRSSPSRSGPRCPERCVVDGEVVIARDGALDFESLLLRIHPGRIAGPHARGRVAGHRSSRGTCSRSATRTCATCRRASGARGWRRRSAASEPPVHLTPATTDRDLAADWFDRFEGAGLDGVVAKRLDAPYQPGKRAMLKIKHQRTADCVVAGFRWHKNGPGTHVGSLLLGLFDDAGTLHHVGITSSFSWDRRAALVEELAPLRENALDGHPVGGVGRVGRLGSSRRLGPAPARARRPAGTAARTCRGSRCGRSASSRSPTTTSRATASATPRRSSAGARTSRRRPAATTSSRRRRRTRSSRSSAADLVPPYRTKSRLAAGSPKGSSSVWTNQRALAGPTKRSSARSWMTE